MHSECLKPPSVYFFTVEVLANYCAYTHISQERTERELTLLPQHDSRQTVNHLACAIFLILGFLSPERQRCPWIPMAQWLVAFVLTS